MRIKRFDFSATLIKPFLSGERMDIKATENALPPDAELVRVYVNEKEAMPDRIYLFYISESFPDVKEGYMVQGEKIMFTRYYNEQEG